MPTKEHIRTDIVRQLAWDSRVNVADIKLEIDDSHVTLKGTVPSHTSRQAAYDDVLCVTGIKSVDNQLVIDYSDLPQTSDREIEDNIRRMLGWNPNIIGAAIEVTVANGHVVLRGGVDGYWKKKRIEFLVQDMIGVKEVSNEIAIVPEAQVVDEQIGEDIRRAIQRNVYLSEDNIDVEVNTGTVTLAGMVDSIFTYRKIYDTVYYTPGVIEIKDNLQIRSAL